jgi:hypothetical protein
MHRKRWITVVAASFIFLGSSLFAARETPTSPELRPEQSESSSAKKSKHTPADDLLLRGTVFNEHALSLEGTTLHLRRLSDKRSRWQAVSNFRGEFAVRVPQGSDYEIVAEHKGYAAQTRTVSASNADQNIVFHMEPVQGGKK